MGSTAYGGSGRTKILALNLTKFGDARVGAWANKSERVELVAPFCYLAVDIADMKHQLTGYAFPAAYPLVVGVIFKFKISGSPQGACA